LKIALTGNPNSGKTTLFNAITGKIEHVGNWAGVTVNKKEGLIKPTINLSGSEITAVDLPGAYSMSPFSAEETITHDFVNNENPEVILNIVDATSLNRSLFFTTQLLESGIPVVVALNKSDLTKKKKTTIDVEKLSASLGCPVVETTATKNGDNGLESLMEKIIEVKGTSQSAPFDTQDVNFNDSQSVRESDTKRFNFVKEIVSQIENREIESTAQTKQDIVDRVLAHKWLGLPIFAFIMWAVFSVSQTYLGLIFANVLADWVDTLYNFAGSLLGDDVSPLLRSLLLDGIIGGVGAVISFLPYIMVLFFLLSLLEDSGYMARVAVVMDRFFKKVGLSGKSIIPIVIGTGCSIPGIMSTKTIPNERQRRTTAMLTPFIPCGAKLPVIALFAGVFFQDAAWVGTMMYFVGIALIVIGALVVVRVTGEKNVRTFFILELPEYRMPSLKRAIITTFSRGKAFVVKAGTIILLCNAVVQVMQTFDWQLQVVADNAPGTSILAGIASPFAFLLIPLGFGVWQLAAAAITGFVAKENVVGTLAVVYGITNFIDPSQNALVGGATEVASVMGLTHVTALAFLMFNLYTPPCFAAIGAMNSELTDKKWLWYGVAFQFGMGYIVAFITYQLGSYVTTGTVGGGFMYGLSAVIVLISILIYAMYKGDKKENELLNAQAI